MNDFVTVFTFIDTANKLLDRHQRAIYDSYPLFVVGIALILCTGLVLLIRKKSGFLNLIILGICLIALGINAVQSNIKDYNEVQKDYSRLLRIYQNQEYKVAEGIIHVLHTQPHEGHTAGDIIQMGDTKLVISHFRVTLGYKDTLAYGGILKEGTYARIYYFYDENFYSATILRIDLKRSTKSQGESSRNTDPLGDFFLAIFIDYKLN